MKKLFIVVFCIVSVFTFAACSMPVKSASVYRPLLAVCAANNGDVVVFPPVVEPTTEEPIVEEPIEATPTPVETPPPTETPIETPEPVEPTGEPIQMVCPAGGIDLVLEGVNLERVDQGVEPFTELDDYLTQEAQRWAEKLASEKRIYHENMGKYAESIGHTKPLVGAGQLLGWHFSYQFVEYTRIGIGTAVYDGYYVVVLFCL